MEGKMELPKKIYLVQPYPDTADAEWCEDPAMYGVKKEDAVLYKRVERPNQVNRPGAELEFIIELKRVCEGCLGWKVKAK
jgi:hypothetical protein